MSSSPSSHAEIVHTVTEIVAGALRLPAETLAADLNLRTVEGTDSVKVLLAIARIEREYGIEIEDEDVFTLTTINDVVRIVQAQLAETTTV
ncbi:acyl carrier protein [Frankia torreyi]|uniref:Acyl carrier protein n=1 Tax=Frankia torreyi TaxID=1856 RepID=A0A0D8B833_9ACTN|nr:MULTISPECIES: acyl carrier protein [Frankia]KJE20336.1 acyl carrier protein [Frankia torreyi]KQC39669.1 phosphopantetheine-binding protein [Frankia sp. ACN1ag]KQM02672.1 acyl carrier protein [Frankia sp. CpI1-P]